MFSELVDEVVSISGRADKRAAIVSHVNGTIREAASQQYFNHDMVEMRLTADAEPFIWTKPDGFRLLRTARYVDTVGTVDEKKPGRIQEDEDYYYYGGAGYMVFVGVETGAYVDVAFYKHQPRLLYYSAATRPAVYNELAVDGTYPIEGGDADTWYYLDNGSYVTTTGDTDDDEALREKVTNWVLLSWRHLVLEGALAKLYLTLKDERGPRHFTLFKTYMMNLLQSESFDTLSR